jgi:NAD(P)-dependent dehydrogenase (short-subunit alcohol dehydrogenase family)
MTEVTGKTYFITGINRGIGRELVRQILLGSQDSRVIGTIRKDIPEDSEFQITKDPRLTILKLDLSDYETYLSISKELESLDTGIDVFISNAASNTARHNVLHSSPKEYLDFFNVNAIGPIEILKILKPYLLKKETRKVIFTSSILGSIGNYPEFLSASLPCAPYSVSKSALNSLGVQLSHELKGEGFIVINYHPGLINTKVKDTNDDISARRGFQPNEEFLRYVSKNTLDVEEGAKKELQVIDGLTPDDNGKFLTFDGSEVGY